MVVSGGSVYYGTSSLESTHCLLGVPFLHSEKNHQSDQLYYFLISMGQPKDGEEVSSV